MCGCVFFSVSGCWTVRDDAPRTADSKAADHHAFLLISTRTGTRVLSTGADLMEPDNTEFYVRGPTLGAGNVFCRSPIGTGIVQVYPTGVRLLDRAGAAAKAAAAGGSGGGAASGGSAAAAAAGGAGSAMDTSTDSSADSNTAPSGPQDIPMGPNRIVWCSISDPYIVLVLNDGSLRLLTANETDRLLSISMPVLAPRRTAGGDTKSSIVEEIPTVSLYCDRFQTGLFVPPIVAAARAGRGATGSNRVDSSSGSGSGTAMSDDPFKPAQLKQKDEEVEAMLFGDDDSAEAAAAAAAAEKEKKRKQKEAEEAEAKAAEAAAAESKSATAAAAANAAIRSLGDYACVVCRGNLLEIYSVPDFTRLFVFINFPVGYKLVTNQLTRLASSAAAHAQAQATTNPAVTVTSITSGSTSTTVTTTAGAAMAAGAAAASAEDEKSGDSSSAAAAAATAPTDTKPKLGANVMAPVLLSVDAEAAPSAADLSVDEVCIAHVGSSAQSKPHLFACLSNGDVLAYECFTYAEPGTEPSAITVTGSGGSGGSISLSTVSDPTQLALPLRLLRVQHNLFTRPLLSSLAAPGNKANTEKKLTRWPVRFSLACLAV